MITYVYRNNDGMTARHLAASDSNEMSAKILYILHAVGAARCPFLMASCHPGCTPDGTENGIPPSPAPGPAHRAVSSILQVCFYRSKINCLFLNRSIRNCHDY